MFSSYIIIICIVKFKYNQKLKLMALRKYDTQ